MAAIAPLNDGVPERRWDARYRLDLCRGASQTIRRANAQPSVVRIADANRAFVPNVVENVQRRELSGRERVRAIHLLGSLRDGKGRPLGVREISRLTGLSPATISLWLRIHQRPSLTAALEARQLDIGRAMLLAPVPEEELDGLIDRAAACSQQQLRDAVAALQRDPRVVARRAATLNERRLALAHRLLMSVDTVEGPACDVLDRIWHRVEELRSGPARGGGTRVARRDGRQIVAV
jgi:transcriptional regulator with XRE-family HTH domain